MPTSKKNDKKKAEDEEIEDNHDEDDNDDENEEEIEAEDDEQIIELKKEASAGSMQAQYQLGLHYLNVAQNSGDSVEASKIGVGWLIKASRQGSPEATEKLKFCVETKFGVDDSNLGDATYCIRTPYYEKVAREAAKRMFSSIQPFNDRNTISKADYDKAIAKMDFGGNKMYRSMLEKLGRNKDGRDEITEEMFVGRMMKRLQGRGGISSILQNDVEWEAYNSATFVQKITKYPGKSMVWLADNAIDMAGSQGRVWLKSLIPVNQVYMLFIIFIYSVISLEAVIFVVPLVIFWISFVAMMISTMQMFYSKRKLNDVKALAEMLSQFNEQFEQETAESTYSWTTITPYASFFILLLVMIASFSVSDKTWIPSSELALISFVTMVACFLALSDSYDKLAILSIAIDNFSTFPVVIASLTGISRIPQIPVVYTVLKFFFGSGFSFEILPEFFLQISIPSLSYLVVPVIFFFMARKNQWSGTYRILIPHLVCFFWWRVVVMFFLTSTWLGLVRASVGWILFIFLLPFLLICLCIVFIYMVLKVFTVWSMVQMVTTIGLFALIVIFGVWAKGGFSIGTNFNVDQKSVRINLVLGALVVLVACVPAVYWISPEGMERKTVYLDWMVYKEACGPEAWARTSMADTQAVCGHFSDAKVNWSGTVKQTRIKKLENQAEKFMDYLPTVSADWLRCLYGEAYAADCTSLEDFDDRRVCEYNKARGRPCHVKNLNRNTYEISVVIDNVEIKLDASYYFANITMRLRVGDEIQFRAYFTENIGGLYPVLQLYRLQCSTCKQSETVYGGSVLGDTAWNLLLQIKKALQEVWNFFIAPLLQFKFK